MVKCKKCNKCEVIKTPDDFYRKKGNICIKCRNAQSKEWDTKNPLKKHLSHIKSRATKKNLEFDLDIDFIKDLLIKQNGRCDISNIPFSRDPAKKNNTNWPFLASVDRIDNNKGYLKTNVRLVILYLNSAVNAYGIRFYLAISKIVSKRHPNIIINEDEMQAIIIGRCDSDYHMSK